jgi:hypothetical protein
MLRLPKHWMLPNDVYPGWSLSSCGSQNFERASASGSRKHRVWRRRNTGEPALRCGATCKMRLAVKHHGGEDIRTVGIIG